MSDSAPVFPIYQPVFTKVNTGAVDHGQLLRANPRRLAFFVSFPFSNISWAIAPFPIDAANKAISMLGQQPAYLMHAKDIGQVVELDWYWWNPAGGTDLMIVEIIRVNR